MPKYWLSIVSKENFEIHKQMDFAIDGYSERYFKFVLQIEPGDRIVYYIKGLKGFGAICQVLRRCFIDWKRIWPGEVYPCRFETRCELTLSEGRVLPVKGLIPHLAFIPQNLKNELLWGLAFRGSLKRLPEEDFQLIEQEMRRLI